MIFYRLFRVEQVVQRYLYPIARVCPKNKRHGVFFAAHPIVSLLLRNKNQPLGVVISETVIDNIALNSGDLELSDNRAVRRRFYGSDGSHTAQRQQTLMRHGIRSDYPP